MRTCHVLYIFNCVQRRHNKIPVGATLGHRPPTTFWPWGRLPPSPPWSRRLRARVFIQLTKCSCICHIGIMYMYLLQVSCPVVPVYWVSSTTWKLKKRQAVVANHQPPSHSRPARTKLYVALYSTRYGPLRKTYYIDPPIGEGDGMARTPCFPPP